MKLIIPEQPGTVATPTGSTATPLGLRALVQNRVRVVIEGRQVELTVK